MEEAICQDQWEWFGDAGHLIVSSKCQFHLCTLVGRFLVSTVGKYLPDEEVREIIARYRGVTLSGKGDARAYDFMRQIGYEEIGADRTFETMVFLAGERCNSADCYCGMPKINGHELDADGYNDAGSATKGHYAMCEKWAITARQVKGDDL